MKRGLVLTSLAFLLLVGCAPSLESVQDRIATLESKIATLEKEVASLKSSSQRVETIVKLLPPPDSSTLFTHIGREQLGLQRELNVAELKAFVEPHCGAPGEGPPVSNLAWETPEERLEARFRDGKLNVHQSWAFVGPYDSTTGFGPAVPGVKRRAAEGKLWKGVDGNSLSAKLKEGISAETAILALGPPKERFETPPTLTWQTSDGKLFAWIKENEVLYMSEEHPQGGSNWGSVTHEPSWFDDYPSWKLMRFAP